MNDYLYLAAQPVLAEVTQFPRIWYAMPLIVAISLVYGATRHERTYDVLVNGFKTFAWIMFFALVILALILAVGYWT